MKKTWIYGVILSALLVSCTNSEDALTPSLKDIDRVATQIDLSNPVVAQLYEDFNTGLLYTYEADRDFRYIANTVQLATTYDNLDMPQLKDRFLDETGNVPEASEVAYQANVDNAIAFVNSKIFQYFRPNSTIASLMPRTVLISDGLDAGTLLRNSYASTEGDSRAGKTAIDALHAAYNENSIVINVKPEDITANATLMGKDDFYIFLIRIMEMHNLFAKVPASFSEGKDAYYGLEMETPFRTENGYSLTDIPTSYIIDKAWFYSKGFIDAQYFYNGTTGLGTVAPLRTPDGTSIPTPRPSYTKAIRPNYIFVADMQTDVRSYINEMIHRNSSEFTAFPANIKANIVMLTNLLDSWGVDIKSVNPALNVLYP